MISQIQLKNFAAFKELKLDLSPKINVVIGENSCGKTQLLKAAYALNATQSMAGQSDGVSKSEISNYLTTRLLGLFKPETEKVGALFHNQAAPKSLASFSTFDSGGAEFGCEIASSRSNRAEVVGINGSVTAKGLFIPTREVLSLLPAIAKQQISDTVLRSLFDDSVVDLCRHLLRNSEANIQEAINEMPRLGTLLPVLIASMGGRYDIQGDIQQFIHGGYIEKSRSTSKSKQAEIYSDGALLKFSPSKTKPLSTSMTAEGYRKIGVLQRLLENGELNVVDYSPLFWDEPESNLNPKLMKMLVACLLELSRNGKQVILASHDYVLLKWFDLLQEEGKEDHVVYHSLFRDEVTGSIKVNSTDNYLSLSPNPIDEAFGYLIDQEIHNDMGELGK